MIETKCCGNCKHFANKDVDGCGFCTVVDDIVVYRESCEEHIYVHNGWIEITPDNVEELKNFKRNRVVICAINSIGYMYPSILANIHIPLDSIAEYGGSYYYVLPELKIE